MSSHLDPTQQLLAAEGACPPEQQAHLAGCAACGEQVRQLQELNAAVAEPLPEDSAFGDPGPRPWSDDPEMSPGSDSASITVTRGSLLGRYEILDELGQGGMGVVYAAYDRELSRKVAVKLIKPGRGKEAQARLLREAQAMARISHPNVLPVFDVGTFGQQVFVAMEFVDGGTLRTWLKTGPSWREVLTRFLAAGRGLVAAHQVGLVHRDFKPDNVLVGKDGRIFVTDFGLARLTSDGASDEKEEAATASTQPGQTASGLSAQLTQVGTVMGTPAYMAPEQHLGRIADARSDQFSFAAALYLGLWQQRPFDPQQLAAAAALSSEPTTVSRTSGARPPLVIQPPPPGAKVPSWLRDAVLRALSLRPEDRYPSMDALLSELEKRLAVNRRGSWAAVAAVTLLAGTTAVVGHRQVQTRAQLCSGGPQLLARAWAQPLRARLEQAFLATGLPEAPQLSSRTVQVLEDYGSDWVAMHREACEATRLREEQPEAVLTLRMACLDRRLQELRSLTGLLAAPDVKLVRASVDAALQLAPVSHCAQVSALLGRTPPPEEPARRQQLEEITSVLAEASALRYAARFADSLARIAPQVEAAQRLGYRPLEAEVLYAQGFALDRTGKRAEGKVALEGAFHAADAGRDDLLRAQAANRLLYIAGQQSLQKEARRWERAARSAIERLGGNRELESDLLSMVGNRMISEGQVAEGMAALRQGLEAITAELGPDSAKRASHLTNLAAGLVQLGRYQEALPLLREVIALNERMRGDQHSSLAAPLNLLSVVLSELKQFGPAHHALDRALAIVRLRYGEKHTWVGDFLDRKASIYQAQGQLEPALETYRAALDAKRRSLPPGATGFSYSLDGIGQCLALLGRHHEALGVLEEALSLRGEDTLGRADTRFALARTLKALGRSPARIRTLLAEAGADYRQAGRADKEAEVAAWAAARR